MFRSFLLAEQGFKPSHIHKGELEMLTQHNLLPNNHVVHLLCDDRKAVAIIKKLNFEVKGTFFIIAKLDIQFNLCSYFECVKKLKESGTRISDDTAKKIYLHVKTNI